MSWMRWVAPLIGAAGIILSMVPAAVNMCRLMYTYREDEVDENRKHTDSIKNEENKEDVLQSNKVEKDESLRPLSFKGDEQRLAFASGSHDRLAGNSPILHLDIDVFKMIGEISLEIDQKAKKHLKKGLDSLKQKFPKIDEGELETILKKNEVHIGKAIQEVFRKFSGVEEIEEEKKKFYKKYPGALRATKEITLNSGREGIVYGWDLQFDPNFVSNPMTINVKDNDGNDVELQAVSCSILIDSKDENIHYPNFNYFHRLASKGDSPYCEGEWGSDPNDIYDEHHPSNPEGFIPTKRELESIIINFKTALLGEIPFIDTDNDNTQGIYQGINLCIPNGKKRKLPEGWHRGAAEEYNGLYYYYQEGCVPQWKHPLD